MIELSVPNLNDENKKIRGNQPGGSLQHSVVKRSYICESKCDKVLKGLKSRETALASRA